MAGYRFEPLVIVLVALAALPILNVTGPQDITRYELTRHLVQHGTLTVERGLFDRAEFGGRTYSDKAPGMSFLAVPAFELERVVGVAKPPYEWRADGDRSLWLIHVLTSGLLFLAAVVVVGRLAERIAPGTGAASAATFGVATLAMPLAPSFFEHDSAAALGIGAFALAHRGRAPRLALAGLCAGTAVLFQYATALVVVALAAYCVWLFGRAVLWYLLGAVPPVIALGAYDWVAFGSPFHLSYRYVANPFTERQHHGFFGIAVPTLDGLHTVLVGNRGLLVFSPVTVAAAVGLVLLWRRGARPDALLAGAITIAFVLLTAGYFVPYGGNSPGPRFLVPALPFLALGLPLALRRFPWTTVTLATISVGATVVQAVSWSIRSYKSTSWIPKRTDITKTLWTSITPSLGGGALIVLCSALAALAVGVFALRRPA